MNRRGFLKSLGKGAAVGAAMATPAVAMTVGVDPGKGEDWTAFNFTCTCGESVIGRVPKEVNTELTATCASGHEWLLKWKGDSFDAMQKPPNGESALKQLKEKAQAYADPSDYDPMKPLAPWQRDSKKQIQEVLDKDKLA